MTNIDLNNPTKEEQLIQLTYRLGRHLLNPDNIELTCWSVMAGNLLIELHDIDPDKYLIFMKPTNAP